MKHPKSRAERRYAREIARNHFRRTILTFVAERTSWHSENADPAPEPFYSPLRSWSWKVWYKGGKWPWAHGNRCMCRYEKRAKKPLPKDLRKPTLKEFLEEM